LHAKPTEIKDFLHEVNKTSGAMTNGLIMSTAFEDEEIIIWDPTNRALLMKFKDPKFKFAKNSLCTTSEYGGVVMACHGTKTQITCWQYDSQQKYISFTSKEPISCLKAFNNGANCIAGNKSGSLNIWNTQTGHLVGELSAHYEEITNISFSSDESMIATASTGGQAKLWIIGDILTATESRTRTDVDPLGQSEAAPIAEYKGHTESITGIEINKFDNRLYTCSLDKQCIIWDLFTGMQIKALMCLSGIVCMTIDSMETTVYLACKNKNVY